MPQNQPRFVKWLVRIEATIAGVLVATIFTLVLAQAGSRRVLGRPLSWTEEVSRFSLVWLTFIGAAMLVARGRHIMVDLITPMLSDRASRALDAAMLLVVAFTCGVLVWPAVNFSRDLMSVASPFAGIPMGIVYLGGTLGLALMALHALVNAYLVVRYGEQVVEHAVPEGL